MPHTMTAEEPRRFFMTKEQRRFIKFAIVGGSGVFVNLGVVAFAGTVGSTDTVAILAGIIVSIFTNFLINDGWTWRDREKRGLQHWFRRLGLFYVANGLGAAIQFGVSLSVYHALPFDSVYWGIGPDTYAPLLAALVGIGVATPVNFVLNNKVTFRDTNAG